MPEGDVVENGEGWDQAAPDLPQAEAQSYQHHQAHQAAGLLADSVQIEVWQRQHFRDAFAGCRRSFLGAGGQLRFTLGEGALQGQSPLIDVQPAQKQVDKQHRAQQ